MVHIVTVRPYKGLMKQFNALVDQTAFQQMELCMFRGGYSNRNFT
jgi:hypothetical protein